MFRQKTGTEFSIQLLPELVAELALHQQTGAVRSMLWLTTEHGTHTRAGGDRQPSDYRQHRPANRRRGD
jgi:hypothetical protein